MNLIMAAVLVAGAFFAWSRCRGPKVEAASVPAPAAAPASTSNADPNAAERYAKSMSDDLRKAEQARDKAGAASAAQSAALDEAAR